jgi:predicted esterase
MPGRLPSASDLPSEVTAEIIPRKMNMPNCSRIDEADNLAAAKNQPPTNVLILLHGLGDTHKSFAQFGRAMALPETACIAVRGPAPLPFDLEGFHFGDDIVFDEADGGIDADTGFKKSAQLLLNKVIRETLIQKCGYQLREIVLFGFGQGGMAALHVASELPKDEELGGVVSLGGYLPASSAVPDISEKLKTPILVCKGERKSAVHDEHIDRLRDTFRHVEVKEWRRTGDSMPSNRDEMLPIMQFFARRLRSRQGVPAGSVELS